VICKFTNGEWIPPKMSSISPKRLRFYPLLEFSGSVSTGDLRREFIGNCFAYPSLSGSSVSSGTLPVSLNSSQDFGKCSAPTFHSSESCLRTDSPNIGDCSQIFQTLETSSSPNGVILHEISHCSSGPLEWDHRWDNGDKAKGQLIHSQGKDHDVQFETSIDSIWTWPTCRRACDRWPREPRFTRLQSPRNYPLVTFSGEHLEKGSHHVSVPVTIDHPARERQPTPPPSPLPLQTSSQAHLSHIKCPVPQFLHSTELAHNFEKPEVVQCNNHSLSGSHVDLSTRELCEAVTRAEMWTQRSMKGLREHTRSLLAATEAEERRLRARLASLQNQMMMAVETERSKESSESTSICENTAVERQEGYLRNQEQVDEVTTNVDFNTSAAAPQFDRHRRENVYTANEKCFAKGDLSSTQHAISDLRNAGDIVLKEPMAVGEGDASADHLSTPNCCITPLRDEELPDNTNHSDFQHLYRRPDLLEQEQEGHQSQSDDVVTLIAEETGDHRGHGGHSSIEFQAHNSISYNQSEVCSTTYHLEGAREQLTTSEIGNFCQDEGKEGVSSLPAHSKEVGCEDRLPNEKLKEQDICPGDKFDQIIEDQDIPLESVPVVDEASSKIQDCPSKNSLVSESSLTEVSSSVESMVNESRRFPVEIGEAMKQRFIDLLKEESKKLKTLLLNVERNSSPANNCTDVTSSKSETLDDAPCRSIVNSPPPSPKSSSNLRGPSKSKTSPCCKIASTSRKPNIDVLQMRPAKPTKKLSQTDVEKMYVEFIRASERSRPRHKAFTGLEDSEVTKAKSPVREPFHQTFDSRDCATSTDFHGQQSLRNANPAEDHAFTLDTAPVVHLPRLPQAIRKAARVRVSISAAQIHSAPAMGSSCHVRVIITSVKLTMPTGCTLFYLTIVVIIIITTGVTTIGINHRTPPALPILRYVRKASIHTTTTVISVPVMAFQWLRISLSLLTQKPQSNCAVQKLVTTPETIHSILLIAVYAEANTYSRLTTLGLTLSCVSFVVCGGCSWFEFGPRSHLKGAGATNTKRQSLEREQISKSTHWRPAFRDYSHDATVRFNFSRTNPPYACDREEDFNQRNGSNVDPQSLQEAFRLRMKAFIARSEARQRFIRLNALERRLRAKHGAMRSMNNCNTVLPDKEMGLRAGTSCLRLPDYLRCPQFLSTIGQTAYSATRPKKLNKSNRKLLAPYEAHRLFQVQKKSNLFTNRARMKQYSEVIC
uniref:ALMS motif domain-containing protein n=1 Tax=Echinococcus canadensis TaxID=519352 RepID=A0A915EYP0_9CEST